MKRKRTVRPSKVDKAIKELIVGQKIKITGSVSYWRNRQAKFHKENPSAWVSIITENKSAYAERLY